MSIAAKIESFWYRSHWIKWLLFPFSIPFYLLVQLKRLLYFLNLYPAYQSKVPVLVVGNINVGGTGKTPFIAFLAKHLKLHNIKFGIVSRGYQSNIKNTPHIVHENDTVSLIGDEAFMQFNSLKVPMAIGLNRAAVIQSLTEKHQLDLIISDDGLQHYKMMRDYEIVLVDAQRMFGNQMILPFGPLREPISRLKTVDLVIQNGGKKISPFIKNVHHALMTIKVTSLVHICSKEVVTLNNLKNQHVNAVCAIGNPERFFNSLKPFCKSFSKLIYPDHHPFIQEDFEQLDDNMVIMTEKDAVKCNSFAKDNWYYLKINAEIDKVSCDQLMTTLKQIIFTKEKSNE